MTFNLNVQLQLDAMLRHSVRVDSDAFQHYAAKEAAAVARMMASLTQANITEDVMQRALGIADQNAFRNYAESTAVDKYIGSTSDALKLSDYSDWTRIDRFSTGNEALCAQATAQQHLKMYSSAAVEQVRSIAELAQTYTLHAALEPFRTAAEPLTNKLLHLQSLDAIKSSAYLNAFMQASTLSDIFGKSIRVDHQLQEAMRQFTHAPILPFDSLNAYRQFLDSAGLGLSHWPHHRLLTIGEKRRRFKERLKQNTESSHAKKGRTLTQRYELTLRDILDEVMVAEYGEDWAIERLPLCDCKDLLGKWQKRGGDVLDHADYAHYEKIMIYPAHFESVFEVGFNDPTELAVDIKKAGKLRAALQHFHPFTAEDLLEMRLIWRTIETGLLALTDDYDFDNWN